MKQTAKARYIRMAPRKVRLVADMVKGLTVNEAEAQLMYERRRAARPLLKLLRSAAANAKVTKRAANADALIIESVTVDQGPMLKRFLPRARGMASPIQKKMSHVTLVLTDEKSAPESKYKIIVKKKAKKQEDEGRRKAGKRTDHEHHGEEAERKEPQKGEPGFMRRFFRRKSV